MKRKSRKEKRKSGPVLPVSEQEKFKAKERKEEAKKTKLQEPHLTMSLLRYLCLRPTAWIKSF